MIKMHLVQVDAILCLGQIEKSAANVGEDDW
jgi:hypothetical protein